MTTALTMEIEEPPTKKTICSTKLTGRSNGGFVDLPAEIILIIFGFLAKIDLVHLAGSCARFRILTKDSSLWKELSLGKVIIKFVFALLLALTSPCFSGSEARAL